MKVQFSSPDIEKLRKDNFLVDMHFHSKYSHDSSTKVEDIIKRCEQLGVRVALTDHNSIGGVVAANKLAPGTVLPGIEVCTSEGKDILLYFYSVNDLVDFYEINIKPNLKMKTSLQSNSTKISAESLLEKARGTNCLIGLPHPFAVLPRRNFMFFNSKSHNHLMRHVHAIEVINQTMLHKQNLASIGWAMQHSKAFIGGSDGHTISPLGSAFTYSGAGSWEEFLDSIKRKDSCVIGEQRKARHQFMDATRMMREKARFIKNFRPHRK